MKMVRNVVVALAVLASATMAQAASFAWFTAANTNGNGAGAAGGAQGSRLDLTCDTSVAGSCSWVITMKMNYGAGLGGWNADLLTAPGNGVSSSNGTIAASNPWQGANSLANGGTGGSGAALLSGAQGQTFSVLPGGTVDMITFTLTRNFASGDLTTKDIFVKVPVSPVGVEWFNGNDGDYEFVSFGGNAPVQAVGGGEISVALPVIRITSVPEPTTLALLALGGLAAFRRKVAR